MFPLLSLLLACPPDQGLSSVKDDDAPGDPDTADTSPPAPPGLCDSVEAADPGRLTLAATCLDEGEPSGPVTDPWNLQLQWTLSAIDGMATPLWSYVMPAAGDLDGDGLPEVVSVVTTDTLLDTRVVALDGATGAVKWYWRGALATGSVLVADVTGDGTVEVVAFDERSRPVALSGDGRLLWTSSRSPSGRDYPLVSAADLDADGTPEVIADDLVLDGRTGAREFSLDVPDVPDPYRMAAIGDVDGDGRQEIAFDGRLFDSTGALRWDSGVRGGYGMWPVIVDADGDGSAEIGFVGEEWTLLDPSGSVIHAVPYGMPQPGPPCAGDFDGDGTAEIAWPAWDTLVLYELDGTPVWSTPITDASGLSGCSGFDVDGDGALEVLYADEIAFRILDGRTGAARVEESSHRSGTVFEYPVPVDLDGDNHAEILTARNGFELRGAAVAAWEHAGAGWMPGGPSWGVHDFAITNLLPDGTVPRNPVPSWQAWNVYRARVAADALGAPDLVATLTDACVGDCAAGPFRIAVQVGNQGGTPVAAGAWLSVYARETDGSRRWLARFALPTVPALRSLPGVVIPLRADQVGSAGWEVVADDDGTGTGQVDECDETNNLGSWSDVACD